MPAPHPTMPTTGSPMATAEGKRPVPADSRPLRPHSGVRFVMVRPSHIPAAMGSVRAWELEQRQDEQESHGMRLQP